MWNKHLVLKTSYFRRMIFSLTKLVNDTDIKSKLLFKKKSEIIRLWLAECCKIQKQKYRSHSRIQITFNTFNHNHIQGPFSQPRNKITFNKIFHTQETKIVFNNHIQGFFFLSTTFFLSTLSFSVNNFLLLSTNPIMLLGKLMYPLAIVMKALTFSRLKF